MKRLVISAVLIVITMTAAGCLHCNTKEGETMRPLASALDAFESAGRSGREIWSTTCKSDRRRIAQVGNKERSWFSRYV